MTADIVNLRRVRKAKLKAGKDSAAASNRLLFGRTGAERALQTLETARADHHLEGHRRSDPVRPGMIRADDGED